MNKISAEIIADSQYMGHRLTTFKLTLPKYLLQELNTHRAFSRSAASARAIPVNKFIAETFTPSFWGKNKPGMQAEESLKGLKLHIAKAVWYLHTKTCKLSALILHKLGLHKQLANRCCESHSLVSCVVTSSERGLYNFFFLRAEEQAEPAMAYLATCMLGEYLAHEPKELTEGDYHLPFILPEEESESIIVKLVKSVSRCARVSYNNFYGKKNFEADCKLHKQLRDSGHWSPFEHQARAASVEEMFMNTKNGNFTNVWIQHRQEVENAKNRGTSLKEIYEKMKILNKKRGYE